MKLESQPIMNRELSWLGFNQRVLEEALDSAVPLLERAKFLAITGSNLDEFFMVRVGGLHLLVKEGRRKRDPSGMTPQQQLRAVAQASREMINEQYRCYNDELSPALEEAGIKRLRPDELTADERGYLQKYFDEEVYPVVTPMVLDADCGFPLLVNQSVHMMVRLSGSGIGKTQPFAVFPLGRNMNRFVPLPQSRGYHYILLEDLVALYIDRFFPGKEVMEATPFRITRNADLAVEQDLVIDLLAEMQEVLKERRKSDCVRLEVSDKASRSTLHFLTKALSVDPSLIHSVPGPVGLSALMHLSQLDGFDELQYEAWPPQESPEIDSQKSLFEMLSNKNLLLCHPYESFDPVLRLVEEASADPDVMAIKQILYRISRNSPMVAALKRAATEGKYVTVIVELKARFDEARNIEWAQDMEEAGVQVIYGIRGLKTHAKVCIVVRREPHGVQRYVHFGTGNYNEATARLYTDISYMTSDEELGRDASTFFNAVTGYSQVHSYRKLAAAPLSLREKILELIENEIVRKESDQKAHIMAKMNSLTDPEIIAALYRASQAGVKIELNVRGICCLRPGMKGVSKNIRVVSIIDRFLEHSRIFYFYHGGDEQVFISSADWMSRNIDRRIELFVPVEDKAGKKKLIHILKTCLKDTAKGREIRSDGTHRKPARSGKKPTVRCQEELYREARQRALAARQPKRTEFVPYKAPESDSA